MRRAVLKLSTWACIAIMVAVLIGFIYLWAGPRETWVVPDVVGRIDYTDAGASKECIMANIRLDGKVLPISIEESGRFRALPVKAYRFGPEGDRTSFSLVEIWTYDGKGVDYELGLDQSDFSCDDTPKTYFILVYFTSSGSPILRATYLPGRVRKTIGSSELQKYIDRLDNRQEFEEWLERMGGMGEDTTGRSITR
jgi:hypothetical protein